jgi:protein-S-isoprenylcysteine O-methyltransferase Ste14
MLIWIVWALHTKRARQRLSFGPALTYMFPTGVGAYLLFGRYRTFVGDRHLGSSHFHWIAALGVALTAAGLLLAIWARAYLGQNWSGTVTVKIAHSLVRTGPYRVVRHPIYTGIVLAMAGTALCQGRLFAYSGAALAGLGLWLKSRLEERFMIQTFGSEYEEYRRSTGALFPRLQ